MALSNENNKISYTPSAGTTVFDGWNISYFNNSDVVVNIETASGTITTFINETGFSVVATNGDPATGATITLDAETVAGDTVTISREVPYTQEYDLQDGSTIDPTALNKALDRTVAQSQQIVDDASRHLTHPITDPAGLNYEAPSVTARASKFVGWDTNGEIIAVDVGGGGGLIGVDTSKGLAVSGGIVEGKVDGTTLAFSSGDFSVKTGGIDTPQLATGAVETAKIADSNVTTLKIADANVTLPKIDFFIDEDSMALNSAVKVPSQQSVKAYVDTEVAAGGLVQIVNVQTGETVHATGVGVFGDDDLIPQNTQGMEVMTLVVSPTSASNNLKIDIVVNWDSNGGDRICALFTDSNSDAIACVFDEGGSTIMGLQQFSHFMVSGTTNDITFKVHIGGSGSTHTLNGQNNNSRRKGGTIASSITITEIKV